jgi:hypothetical protein
MRAGQPDWLLRNRRISVKLVPDALTAASSKISSPSGVSGVGNPARGAPPNSDVRRARAAVKPAL